jgi:hypothetical protein
MMDLPRLRKWTRFGVANTRFAEGVLLLVGFAALAALTVIGSGSAGGEAVRGATTIRSGDAAQFFAAETRPESCTGVSGDLVGDSNPIDVYQVLCPHGPL